MLRLFREHLGGNAFGLVRTPVLERGRCPLQRIGGLRRPDLLRLSHHAFLASTRPVHQHETGHHQRDRQREASRERLAQHQMAGRHSE
jgi:hypothetical protein